MYYQFISLDWEPKGILIVLTLIRRGKKMPSFSSWTCDLNTDPGLAAWRDPRHRAAPAAEPSTCPVWVGCCHVGQCRQAFSLVPGSPARCFALPITSPGASHAQPCPALTTGPDQPGLLSKLACLNSSGCSPLKRALWCLGMSVGLFFPSGRVTSAEDLRVGLLKALDIGLAQFPLKYRSSPLAAQEAKHSRQGAPMQHPQLQHRAGRLWASQARPEPQGPLSSPSCPSSVSP